MDSPSGQFKAGTILLLIGAILETVGAFFLLVGGLFALLVGHTVRSGSGSSSFPATVVGTIYLILAPILAVGAVFGYLAHARAHRGDAHGAWVFGLVSALCPPLQLIPLIGAILCLTSPEHAAAKPA